MSNEITDKQRSRLQTEVNMLLGRARGAFPVPLSTRDTIDFWNKLMIPDDVVAAHKILLSNGYKPGYATGKDQQSVAIRTSETDMLSVTFMVNEDTTREKLIIPQPERLNQTFTSVHCDLIDAHPHGYEGFTQFLEWARQTADLEREFQGAWSTWNALMRPAEKNRRHGVIAEGGWIKTIGQLVRALPDFLSYLSPPMRDAFGLQKRASNMPHEYSLFDRAQLNALQLSLAKAHLLPNHDRYFTNSNPQSFATWKK